MRPSLQGKHFPGGFLTAGDRLWIMQVRQTGWSENPAHKGCSLPASTHSPENKDGEPPQGHKDGINAGKHTHEEVLIKA